MMLSHNILADYSGVLYKPFGTGLSQVSSPNLHTFCHSQVSAGNKPLFIEAN